MSAETKHTARLTCVGPICEVCGGTGLILTMRSWFPADGYSRQRCGICQGTRTSSFRDAGYAREQRHLRAAIAKAEGRSKGDA